MKTPALPVLISLLVSFTAFAAETSVTLKHVHLCCTECVRGVERSLKGLEGVTMTADKDAETVTLTGASQPALQRAADAMAAGGYFGVSDKLEIKPVAQTGSKGKMVQSIIVTGAHMCCGGCAKAVDRAIKKTPGATGHTAKKNSVTFFVNGNFNDRTFFEALQSEGLSGKITTVAAPEPAPEKSKDH